MWVVVCWFGWARVDVDGCTRVGTGGHGQVCEGDFSAATKRLVWYVPLGGGTGVGPSLAQTHSSHRHLLCSSRRQTGLMSHLPGTEGQTVSTPQLSLGWMVGRTEQPAAICLHRFLGCDGCFPDCVAS